MFNPWNQSGWLGEAVRTQRCDGSCWCIAGAIRIICINLLGWGVLTQHCDGSCWYNARDCASHLDHLDQLVWLVEAVRTQRCDGICRSTLEPLERYKLIHLVATKTMWWNESGKCSCNAKTQLNIQRTFVWRAETMRTKQCDLLCWCIAQDTLIAWSNYPWLGQAVRTQPCDELIWSSARATSILQMHSIWWENQLERHNVMVYVGEMIEPRKSFK